jgi:hypothetical protein
VPTRTRNPHGLPAPVLLPNCNRTIGPVTSGYGPITVAVTCNMKKHRNQ